MSQLLSRAVGRSRALHPSAFGQSTIPGRHTVLLHSKLHALGSKFDLLRHDQLMTEYPLQPLTPACTNSSPRDTSSISTSFPFPSAILTIGAKSELSWKVIRSHGTVASTRWAAEGSVSVEM